MKIATKIAFGYGVLIALLLGMLAYQLAVISGTARRSEDLAGVNLRAGVLALQLIRNLDQIEEFTAEILRHGRPGLRRTGRGNTGGTLPDAGGNPAAPPLPRRIA